MDYEKDEIINNALKLVENLKEKHSIKAAYLFGSYSKGFAGKNSDIDIFSLRSYMFFGTRIHQRG